MEIQGIDPHTSRMLSERSTIWATSPFYNSVSFIKKTIYNGELSLFEANISNKNTNHSNK